MTRRAATVATLSAALVLSGLAGTALAQDEAEPTDEESIARTTSGYIVTLPDEDGYFLKVDETYIRLDYGPSWFFDLEAVFPDLPIDEMIEVEVGGNLRHGVPNENASDVAKEKAAKDPVIKVQTLDGEKRKKGKPAWAGGPKNPELGAMHPGDEGWSKGQADKPAKPGGGPRIPLKDD